MPAAEDARSAQDKNTQQHNVSGAQTVLGASLELTRRRHTYSLKFKDLQLTLEGCESKLERSLCWDQICKQALVQDYLVDTYRSLYMLGSECVGSL